MFALGLASSQLQFGKSQPWDLPRLDTPETKTNLISAVEPQI